MRGAVEVRTEREYDALMVDCRELPVIEGIFLPATFDILEEIREGYSKGSA